jgi:hypothetical protein
MGRNGPGDRTGCRPPVPERFLSLSWPGAARRRREVGLAPWPAHGGARTVAGVDLYLVPRTRAWLSEEEVAAVADCMPAVVDTMRGDVRWIRSYIVREDDGTFSGYCLYEASDPEALLRHAEALRLPTDAIKPVTATLVGAPDPEPAGAG